MSEDNININPEEQVLSLEQLERYLDYKLGPKERKHVESIIEGDEFYQDALEGMKLAKQGKLGKIVADINEDIDKVVAKDKSSIKPMGVFRYVAFAASILLLLGVGWYLTQSIQGNQPTVSEIEEYKPPTFKKNDNVEVEKENLEQEETNLDKSFDAKSGNSTSNNTAEKGSQSVSEFFGKNAQNKDGLESPAANEVEKEATKPIMEEVKEEVDLVVEDAEVVEMEEEAEPIGGSYYEDDETSDESLEREVVDENYIEELDKSVATNAPTAAKISAAKVEEQSIQSLNAIETTSASRGKKKALRKEGDINESKVAIGYGYSAEISLNMGMERFNAGDYVNAVNYFESTLKQQSDNRKAQYYGGMAYYNIGNDKEAISNLKSLVNRDGTYSYSSKYFLAQLHVRNGDNRKAKKILEGLSVQPGKFQVESKQLLDKL